MFLEITKENNINKQMFLGVKKEKKHNQVNFNV